MSFWALRSSDLFLSQFEILPFAARSKKCRGHKSSPAKRWGSQPKKINKNKRIGCIGRTLESQRHGIYRGLIIYRNILVSSWPSPFHDSLYFYVFISTQHLNALQMTMDLVFVLKWVESVIGCVLYIFHHSVESQLPDWDSSENKCRRPRPMELYGRRR